MTNKEREDVKEAHRLVTLAWDDIVKPGFSRSFIMGNILDATELLRAMLQTPPRKAARKADGNDKD